MTDYTTHPADAAAIAKMLAVEPAWCALGAARDAIGLDDRTLLHAGPPITGLDALCQPILNSAAVALVYEGLAPDFDQAEAMIRRGEVQFHPAQDFGVVTPLAAVVSASMKLQVVADRGNAARACYAPINGGSGPAPRLGLRTQAALDHIAWLNGDFASCVEAALDEPISLIPLARDGTAAGDDCHGRTPVSTAKLAALLGPRMSEPGSRAALDFLDRGPSFFLNLWMAASKLMLKAAVGVSDSALVTAAGGNGIETGLQVAGLPGRWFTIQATPPRGRLENDMPPSRALGAIGDSAIVDALGLGAMVMSYAPEQQKALMAYMPSDGLELPKRLLSAVHPGFSPMKLWVGLTARSVVAQQRSPVVSLGILDVEGTAGRLGGGIYETPLALFEAAVDALEAGA